jgi:hypothetical protein
VAAQEPVVAARRREQVLQEPVLALEQVALEQVALERVALERVLETHGPMWVPNKLLRTQRLTRFQVANTYRLIKAATRVLQVAAFFMETVG